MRFIHTSDWQIGKVFRQVDDGTMAVLQTERLEAIGCIGRLAREQRAPLVAGDVYDDDKPTEFPDATQGDRRAAFRGDHGRLTRRLVSGLHATDQSSGRAMSVGRVW